MSYTGKTNWQYDEIVTETDLNRIEQGVVDAHAGLEDITHEQIGAASKAEFDTHVNDTGLHVTAAKQQEWNNKANAVHEHAASAITSGTIAAARLPAASVSAAGISKLNNTITSTSTTEAAAAAAVKQVNDKFSNIIRVNAGKLEYFDGATWKGAGDVIYKKPRGMMFTTDLYAQVWTTVLTVNGSSGRINHIAIVASSNNNYYRISIAIDGVEQIITPDAGRSGMFSAGLMRGSSFVGSQTLDLFPNASFENNLVIKVINTAAGSALFGFEMFIDYALA